MLVTTDVLLGSNCQVTTGVGTPVTTQVKVVFSSSFLSRLPSCMLAIGGAVGRDESDSGHGLA